MNSAVITKIEYQLPGDVDFSILDIVPESGKLKEESKRTYAGLIYNTGADFLIAGMTVELNEQIRLMNGRKSYFRITDADDMIYLVGSEDFPARFAAQLDLGGSPGSFKGYRCSISQISTTGCTIQ